MKTKFTREELYNSKGCYSNEQYNEFIEITGNKKSYSIKRILLSDIPLKDKRWFVWNNCGLTLENKKLNPSGDTIR